MKKIFAHLAEKQLSKASEVNKQRLHNLAISGIGYKQTFECGCLDLQEAWYLFAYEFFKAFIKEEIEPKDIYVSYTYYELVTALEYMKKEYRIIPSDKLEKEIKALNDKLIEIDKSLS